MELLIKDIIKGISRSYGESFFSTIALQLDKVIQSDYTFIARIDPVAESSHTVALVAHGKVVDNFTYALADTPCQEVSDNSICVYPCSVAQLYPKDQLLLDMKIEGYLGAPLQSSTGEVIGIVVALYEQEIPDQHLALTLFELFSGRIACEFERLDQERQLIELNSSLDTKVRERTQALESALEHLHMAQDKLIETEKMAALGDLVAGVAHEVNTPLGIAITAESHLAEQFTKFKDKLDAQHLSIKDMQTYVEANEQSLPMIARNLERAKELIINFKSMATDQVDIKSERLSLNKYYQRLISTLTPLLKRKQATITFKGCDNDFINTFPGCHAQLLTNLVTNSIQHGFVKCSSKNLITIRIAHDDNGDFIVDYEDNGEGINEEIQTRIMEPFFTSSRDQINSGLGLSIAYNLASHNLKGSFAYLPSKKGAHFSYQFKSLERSV